jgi:Zn-dependent protease/CBS domain-containing protein
MCRRYGPALRLLSGNAIPRIGKRPTADASDRHHVRVMSAHSFEGRPDVVSASARRSTTRKWSWRVGRIAGIDLYVHVTFPLLFAWIALNAAGAGANARTVVVTLTLTLAVFVMVVLHEGGHALTARRFGIRTRDITLLPIGGIARLERMPREPREELLIAVAGPMVNLVLAGLLYGVLALTGVTSIRGELEKAATAVTLTSAVAQLIAINIWLAAFNLLPAFPMDGGRALRALLVAHTRDYAKATVKAARVGRVFALIFALVGIFALESPMLALIALFIWLAGTSEAIAVQTSAILEHVPVANVMVTDFRTLSPTDSLEKAADLTIEGFQHDFPVLAEGTLVGLLTQRDLLKGLADRGRDSTVAEAMRRDFSTAAADEQADVALERLSEMRGAAMPVMRGDALVGVVTSENVAEFLSLRVATQRRNGATS